MFFYVTFWLSVTTYSIVGGILFLVPVKLSLHESVIFCATTVKLEFWHQRGCRLPQPWPWPWCLAERISNTSDWNHLTGSCSGVKDLRELLTLHFDHNYFGDRETDPERAGWTTSPNLPWNTWVLGVGWVDDGPGFSVHTDSPGSCALTSHVIEDVSHRD